MKKKKPSSRRIDDENVPKNLLATLMGEKWRNDGLHVETDTSLIIWIKIRLSIIVMYFYLNWNEQTNN